MSGAKRTLPLIITVFALMLVCMGAEVVNAGGYMSAGSWYLSSSSNSNAASTYYGSMGTIQTMMGNMGSGASTDLYYCNVYASTAANSAYYASYYCSLGYAGSAGTPYASYAYYASLYANYSYQWANSTKSSTYTMMSNGPQNSGASVSSNSYWTNYYNAWAAYYAGLASYGGAY